MRITVITPNCDNIIFKFLDYPLEWQLGCISFICDISDFQFGINDEIMEQLANAGLFPADRNPGIRSLSLIGEFAILYV